MTSIDFLNKVHKSLDSQEYNLSYSPAKSKNICNEIDCDLFICFISHRKLREKEPDHRTQLFRSLFYKSRFLRNLHDPTPKCHHSQHRNAQ